MRTLLLVLAVVATLAPERADACSCAYIAPTISPADGTTNVPLNAAVIVYYASSEGGAIELRDVGTNEMVAITATVRPPVLPLSPTVFYHPVSPLSPNTTYAVTVNETAPGRTPLTAMFTTGASHDTTPPDFAGLTGIAIETMQYALEGCISSCVGASEGRVSRVHLDYPMPPSDVVHVAFEAFDESGTKIDEVALPAWRRSYLGFETCEPRSPHWVPGSQYCARVVAYDLAANRAEGELVCATVRTCAPMRGGSCEPAALCVDAEPKSSGCSSSKNARTIAPLVGLLVFCRRRRAAFKTSS